MTDPSPITNPRPIYHSGQLLTLDDFNAEQAFHVVARQEQTRRLFGPGALGGLGVDVFRPPVTTPTPSGRPDPVYLRVAPGAAFDLNGRLLLLNGLAQLANAGPVPVDAAGDLLIDVARAPFYVRGQTQALVLALSFGEAPSPQNAERMVAAPVVTLAGASAIPTGAVVLAELNISAPAAPAPPSAGTQPPPDNFVLDVTLAPGLPAPATLAPLRLPTIAADQLSGQLPAAQVSGVLSVDQIPPLPGSRITDWPAITVDALPSIPAEKLQGPLALDQLPAIPASKVTDWPPIMADALPAIPVEKLQGTLTLDQLPAIPASKVSGWPAITAADLPRIPASQIDGLPGPDTGPVAVARLAGAVGTAQAPLLVEVLRRLDALEGRRPTVDGRPFAGGERVSTLMTTMQQKAYRDGAGGDACPNDLADVLGDGFTFQALVRTTVTTGDNPLARYVFEDPAAAGGKVIPGTDATAFAISLRDGAPILQMVDTITGNVDVVSGGAAVTAGAWTLVTCAWKAGAAVVQLEDGPAAQGQGRPWASADGRFEFAADGIRGFTGDVAWFALRKGPLDAQGVAETPRRLFAPDEIAAWTAEGLAGYWPMSGLIGAAAPDLTPVADNGAIGPITSDVPGALPQTLVLEQVADRLQVRWRPGAVAATGYTATFAGADGQAIAGVALPAGDPALGPGLLAQGAASDPPVTAGQAYTASVAAQIGGVDISPASVGPVTAVALTAPQTVRADFQSGSSALVAWTGENAPGGFVVQAWPSDGAPLPDQLVDATARAATLNAPVLDASAGWRVRVGARTADGLQTVWSGPPATVTAVTLDKPTASSLTWDDQKGLIAAWTPVVGADTYELLLSNTAGPITDGVKVALGGDAAAPSAVFLGPAFAAGQAYSFAVRGVAKTDAGVMIDGLWSDPSPASALTLPAIAPINCAARQDGAALVVNWGPGPGGVRPYEARLSDPSGAPVAGVTIAVGPGGMEALVTGAGLVGGGRYVASAHAVDPVLASDWTAAPELTYTPVAPPAPPTAFAGVYLTEAQGLGGTFDPLTIDAAGAVSLGGVPLAATFDPTASRLSWDWTDMRNTRTAGNIILTGSGDACAFFGSVNPRPQAGPVPFKSTSFTRPFRAEIDFSGSAVQATNATLLPDPGMVFNTRYGGWMLQFNRARFRVVFPVSGAPVDLNLLLYNCTSSLWPNNGFSPINIQLNGKMIAERYDPATAHANTGADTTNYLRDTFVLPAGAQVTGDNTLEFTLQPDAKTRYWIRNLTISS